MEQTSLGREHGCSAEADVPGGTHFILRRGFNVFRVYRVQGFWFLGLGAYMIGFRPIGL